MQRRFWEVGFTCAAVAGMSLVLQQLGRRPYVCTDLGTLGGKSSQAFGVNPAGRVVGSSDTHDQAAIHAFLWQLGRMSDLGTLGGRNSAAYAINADDEVVGYAGTADKHNHAFLWTPLASRDSRPGDPSEVHNEHPWTPRIQNPESTIANGVMIDLGTLGGSNSVGYAVNEAGEIVGSADTPDGAPNAFLWTPLPARASRGGTASANGVMVDLGTLGGRASEAYGIDASGDVVGRAQTPDGFYHAFLYRHHKMLDLGTLGGANSVAYGIDADGTVVGSANTSDGDLHAFRYRADQMVDLDLHSGQESVAYSIAADGKVAGSFHNFDHPTNRATLFLSDEERDLNGVVSTYANGVLVEVRAITDGGQLAGRGIVGGNYHAFLLTPR